MQPSGIGTHTRSLEFCRALLSSRPTIREPGNRYLQNDPAKCHVGTSAPSHHTLQGLWLLLSWMVKTGGFLAQSMTWFRKHRPQKTYMCVHDCGVLSRELFKENIRRQHMSPHTSHQLQILLLLGKSLQSVSPGSEKFPTEIHSQGLPPPAPTFWREACYSEGCF